MREWRATTLGALVREAGGSITTGPFGSQLHAHEYVDDPRGVPVVMPKSMVNGRVDRTTVNRVSESTAQRLHTHRLEVGDVVLARRGDVGRCAAIEADEAGWLCGTGSMRVHAPDHSVVLPAFLKQVLQLRTVTEWFVGQAVGATMPNLNAAIVDRLPVRVPNPSLQQRISVVLNAFDELIEINERRVDLLEDLARSLYREWFKRLRFPGSEHASRVGAVPADWSAVTVGETMTLRYGKALPAARRQPGETLVVSSAGVVGTHSESLVSGPGIVLGRKGNVGSVWWVDGDFFPIDTTYYVETELPLSFAYRLLKSITFIDSHAAVPGLSRDQANSIPVVVPTSGLLDRFDGLHKVFFDSMARLRAHNRRLAATRDLLLPRLVTGRLDISEIDLGDLLAAEAA